MAQTGAGRLEITALFSNVDKGYVATGLGSMPRKVLITQEDFDKLYSDSRLVDDGEFNADGDKKFAEYERYIRKHFYDIDDNEEVIRSMKSLLSEFLTLIRKTVTSL